MASCTTSQWGNSHSPQVKLTVTTETSTNTAVTYSWKLQYIADLAASTSSSRSYTVKIDGDTVKSGTYSISGKTGTSTIASGTKTISRGTSARTVKFSVSFAFNLTWSGTYAGTKSASSSFSISAKPKYTITYSANGGSGAPAAQTKYYGSTLPLSGTKPTRTGYSFLGWSTSATATSASYAAGGSYTANASDTLYAVWKANTYTVSYNANGGSGAPASQTKTYGITLTLSSVKPTRTNYNFKGWSTSSTATSASYAPGASYTANAALPLHAVWELAYVKPRITGLTVSRVTSAGTVSDTGTYALVVFSWASDNAIISISIRWKAAADETWSQPKTVPVTGGTSGTVRQVVGDNTISTETSYLFEITVTDSGGSTPGTKMLAGRIFAIDFKQGGKGTAIGKAAEKDGVFEVALDAEFNKDLLFKGVSLETLLLNIAHPIGSIIQTTKSQTVFDPNTMLGGTWRLLQGVFLFGADASHALTSNTKDGGSADAVVVSHNHTQNSHNHTQNAHMHKPSSQTYFSAYTGTRSTETVGEISGSGWQMTQVAAGGTWGGANTASVTATNKAATATNVATGVSGAGKNMPPYKVVNIWERTA